MWLNQEARPSSHISVISNASTLERHRVVRAGHPLASLVELGLEAEVAFAGAAASTTAATVAAPAVAILPALVRLMTPPVFSPTHDS
jgi:hypothetical protein